MTIDHSNFQKCLHGDPRREAARLSTLLAANPAAGSDPMFLRARMVLAARLGRIEEAGALVRVLESNGILGRAQIIQDLSSTPESGRAPLQMFVGGLISSAMADEFEPASTGGGRTGLILGIAVSVVALLGIAAAVVLVGGRQGDDPLRLAEGQSRIAAGPGALETPPTGEVGVQPEPARPSSEPQAPPTGPSVAGKDDSGTGQSPPRDPGTSEAEGDSTSEEPPLGRDTGPAMSEPFEDETSESDSESSPSPSRPPVDPPNAEAPEMEGEDAAAGALDDQALDEALGRFEDNRAVLWKDIVDELQADAGLRQAEQNAGNILRHTMKNMALRDKRKRAQVRDAEVAALGAHLDLALEVLNVFQVLADPTLVFPAEELFEGAEIVLPSQAFRVTFRDNQSAWLDHLLLSIRENREELDIPEARFLDALAAYLDEHNVDVAQAIGSLSAFESWVDFRKRIQGRESGVCKALAGRHRELSRQPDVGATFLQWQLPVAMIKDVVRPEFVLVDVETTIGGEGIPEEAGDFLEWMVEKLTLVDRRRNDGVRP